MCIISFSSVPSAWPAPGLFSAILPRTCYRSYCFSAPNSRFSSCMRSFASRTRLAFMDSKSAFTCSISSSRSSAISFACSLFSAFSNYFLNINLISAIFSYFIAAHSSKIVSNSIWNSFYILSCFYCTPTQTSLIFACTCSSYYASSSGLMEAETFDFISN